MAKKSAKVNKTLEKAKKLVSKKGKSKTTKRSYPEGQNAPQSKAYNMENDKLQSAKSAGWRFTKEGAKKLNKKPTDKPTTSEIEKYRNQTFKVKGKVNKSGPSGSGDGSFRYLYVERRADKSDISKARKLELGGYNPDEMLNVKVYVDVYEDDYEQGEGKNVNSYTVDWLKDPNVLAKDLVKYLSNNLYISDNPNDYIIGDDGVIHTDQLQDSEGSGASKGQIERWKEGKEKLYNAHFTILVTAVKNRKPSVDELSQATGIGTYAKGGEMFIDFRSGNFRKGVHFDPKEVREFEKYVFSYYGKNGIYADLMEEGVPATTGEVLKAVSQYLAYLSSPKKSLDIDWGGGDSIDRELVRDIMIINRNPKASVEHQILIKDMKKTPILEYGGILQPMIGGVNADPRFDIYNTTMFAEKGAEVPEGDEYAKGGETKIYEVAFVKKGKPAQYAASIRAKSEEEAVKEFKKQNSSLPYADMFEVVGVYKTTRRRLEDGGEMARSAKLPKGYRKGGFITTIDDVIASADLIAEAEAKMGEDTMVLNFAYTDYGGDFFDKVAIKFFEENYPDNIVVENTAYSGQNAIVFGEPAREFAEVSERYLLGFDNIEDYYYEMQYEQEREDFENFLDDLKDDDYEVKPEAIDWLIENRTGYYSMLPSGLDFNYSDLEKELVNEGLIQKKED